MGMEIADTLVTVLEPHGVAVHLSANHLCTPMGGIPEDQSKTWTSFVRGATRTSPRCATSSSGR